MHPTALKKDGRAFAVTEVLVEDGYTIHEDYRLHPEPRPDSNRIKEPRRITSTGHLIVLQILPKVEGLTGFCLRWDERPGLLDVDLIGGTRTARSNFRKGLRGYEGHHPEPLPDRRFDVKIRMPGLTVFRGVVSFGLGRETEVPGDTLTLTGYSPVVKITTRPSAP
jgi:hypothetical protein